MNTESKKITAINFHQHVKPVLEALEHGKFQRYLLGEQLSAATNGAIKSEDELSSCFGYGTKAIDEMAVAGLQAMVTKSTEKDNLYAAMNALAAANIYRAEQFRYATWETLGIEIAPTIRELSGQLITEAQRAPNTMEAWAHITRFNQLHDGSIQMDAEQTWDALGVDKGSIFSHICFMQNRRSNESSPALRESSGDRQIDSLWHTLSEYVGYTREDLLDIAQELSDTLGAVESDAQRQHIAKHIVQIVDICGYSETEKALVKVQLERALAQANIHNTTTAFTNEL